MLVDLEHIAASGDASCKEKQSSRQGITQLSPSLLAKPLSDICAHQNFSIPQSRDNAPQRAFGKFCSHSQEAL